MKKLRPLLLLAALLITALALVGCDLGGLGGEEPASVTTGGNAPVTTAPTTTAPASGTEFSFVSNGDGTCYVSGIHIGIDTNVAIPETSPDGDRVTGIGHEAFKGKKEITSVTIPDSVTSIGYAAFSGCTSLTSVTIPDSVTSIGGGAFSGCTSLESITLPFVGQSRAASDSYARFGYIFKADYSISYVNSHVPASLKTVVITGGTRIVAGAFSSCTSLTSVTIPDSVTSIGSSAFGGCSNLESIALPFVGATASGTRNTHFAYIFGASDPGETSGFIPSSLKTVVIAGGNICGMAFCNCDSLTSVAIGDGVTSIGNEAFEDCDSLTSVTIGNGVTSIGWWAFEDCNSLTSVTIGNGVTSIDRRAFEGCSRLVYHEYGNAYYLGNDQNPYHALIKATSKSITSVAIHADTKVIYGSAFYCCASLTSVTIPDSVTSIGDSTFSGCTGLTSVAIPDSVTSIDSQAFYECRSLASVAIPDSVTSIGDEAFRGCTSLTSLTIGNSVTSIGDEAFCGCTSLTSVTIPDSVTSIGDDAFYYCTSLRSATFADTSIWYVTSNSSNAANMTGGTVVDVTNASSNAMNLKDSYMYYMYWYKK